MTPPMPAERPTAAGAPPSVRMAFNLYIAHIGLGVVGAIIVFTQISSLIDAQLVAAGRSRADLPPQTEAAIQSSIVVSVVISLVFLALFLFFLFQMRAGKNWARIVLTVLSVINVVFGLLGFGGYPAWLQIGGVGLAIVIIQILQIILLIAALVFMFRPDANAYFTAPRA